VFITINPPPLANAGNDVSICQGSTAHLIASGGVNYLWSPAASLNNPNIFNPSANPDSTTEYQVIVMDANGCKDIDSVTVFIVAGDTCKIIIYNILTPNGDGSNDSWWIDGIVQFPDNNVHIFNRWGNLIWQQEHYDNRKNVWRGTNETGQPLPAGTYYYVIDIPKLGNFSGWVELLR
jgi:gliding motility-associated-like protein